jgi:hypothetical protein
MEGVRYSETSASQKTIHSTITASIAWGVSRLVLIMTNWSNFVTPYLISIVKNGQPCHMPGARDIRTAAEPGGPTLPHTVLLYLMSATTDCIMASDLLHFICAGLEHTDTIIIQLNPYHTLAPYLPKICFNTILPYTASSAKWCDSFSFSN